MHGRDDECRGGFSVIVGVSHRLQRYETRREMKVKNDGEEMEAARWSAKVGSSRIQHAKVLWLSLHQ